MKALVELVLLKYKKKYNENIDTRKKSYFIKGKSMNINFPIFKNKKMAIISAR